MYTRTRTTSARKGRSWPVCGGTSPHVHHKRHVTPSVGVKPCEIGVCVCASMSKGHDQA